MVKAKINFWIDIIILVEFILLIATGVLLHHFPPESSERIIMGLTRYDWGSLHWILSIMLFSLIVIHLVLHSKWIETMSKRYFKVEYKVVLITITAIFILVGVLGPVYLTREFPSRKVFRQTYPKPGSHHETFEKRPLSKSVLICPISASGSSGTQSSECLIAFLDLDEN